MVLGRLARGRLSALGAILPETAKAFAGGHKGTVIGSPAEKNELHCWRIASGYFWGTKGSGLLLSNPDMALYRTPFPLEEAAGREAKVAADGLPRGEKTEKRAEDEVVTASRGRPRDTAPANRSLRSLDRPSHSLTELTTCPDSIV